MKLKLVALALLALFVSFASLATAGDGRKRPNQGRQRQQYQGKSQDHFSQGMNNLRDLWTRPLTNGKGRGNEPRAYDTPDGGRHQATQNNGNIWGLANLLTTGGSAIISDRRNGNREKETREEIAQLRQDLNNLVRVITQQQQVSQQTPQVHPTDSRRRDPRTEADSTEVWVNNTAFKLCIVLKNGTKIVLPSGGGYLVGDPASAEVQSASQTCEPVYSELDSNGAVEWTCE